MMGGKDFGILQLNIFCKSSKGPSYLATQTVIRGVSSVSPLIAGESGALGVPQEQQLPEVPKGKLRYCGK